MKKIFITVGVLASAISFAQIRTNKTISQDAVADQTPFLDASSTPAWNTSTNIGKGLVFPRVDLTKLTALVGPSRPASNNAPTFYDGMVVYNIATGNSGLGNVAVKPGFYYYENKGTSLNSGTWKPIGGEISTGLPTTATNGQVLKWNGTAWVAQADANTTYTGSTSVVLSGTSFQRAALTGDVTSAQNNNTVTINNGAVTGAKIANGTITADKLAAGVIPAAQAEVDGIIGNEVTNATASKGLVRAGAGTNADPYTLGVADGGITNAMIANNAINSAKIQDGTIVAGDLANNAVTGAKIANGTITADKLNAMGATTAGQVLKWNGTAWAPAADVDTNTTYTAGTGIEITGSNNAIAIKTPVRNVTGNYTLTAADNNGYVYVNVASTVTSGGATLGGSPAAVATVTIPSNLPEGFSCIIVQQGTGTVGIAGNGVTLQTARGTKTRTQYSAVGIIKRVAGEATITGDAVN